MRVIAARCTFNVLNGWKADIPLLEFGSMAYDLNKLEMRALELAEARSIKDALRIYLWMADGDPSLDGGYLGGASSAYARD